MAKFNVIGYDNQGLGQVEASDAVEAWSKAGKKFDHILDIRQVGERAVGWVEGPYRVYQPEIGKWSILPGKTWENDDSDISVLLLTSAWIEDKIDQIELMEPEEYSGILEPENIVVVISEASVEKYVKVFPTFEMAFREAEELVKRFPDFEEMDESGYFVRNKYLGIPSPGA